jgi:hypothetical protein
MCVLILAIGIVAYGYYKVRIPLLDQFIDALLYSPFPIVADDGELDVLRLCSDRFQPE